MGIIDTAKVKRNDTAYGKSGSVRRTGRALRTGIVDRLTMVKKFVVGKQVSKVLAAG